LLGAGLQAESEIEEPALAPPVTLGSLLFLSEHTLAKSSAIFIDCY
jgi:hypothetical protein